MSGRASSKNLLHISQLFAEHCGTLPSLFFLHAEEEFVDSGEESDAEVDENLPYPDAVQCPSARMERSSEMPAGLPSTVEMLSTQDGCRVYLVGTAHFSESSQQDVTKVYLL